MRYGLVVYPPRHHRRRHRQGPCPHCGEHAFVTFWHVLATGDRRIRAECAFCRRFLKFLPHLPEFIHLADENEQPAGLLDLLAQCEDRGIRLVSDGQRVDFAAGDWKKATVEMRTLVKRYSHRLAGMIGKGTT
jgi:hypothetical protein